MKIKDYSLFKDFKKINTKNLALQDAIEDFDRYVYFATMAEIMNRSYKDRVEQWIK